MANDSRDYILMYDIIYTALSRRIERALLIEMSRIMKVCTQINNGYPQGGGSAEGHLLLRHI